MCGPGGTPGFSERMRTLWHVQIAYLVATQTIQQRMQVPVAPMLCPRMHAGLKQTSWPTQVVQAGMQPPSGR